MCIRDSSKVKCFTEKPNAEMAQAFLECGEFLWNSGIFIWRIAHILQAIERYLPEHSALFAAVEDDFGTEREEESIKRIFSQCKPISIDYGVMEAAENVYVHSGDFGWSDVGTWGSVYQHLRKDGFANAVTDNVVKTYDTRNSLISLPKDKVAVISGLKDYIVVDTEDVLMICPKRDEQNIKGFLEDIKYETGDKFI